MLLERGRQRRDRVARQRVVGIEVRDEVPGRRGEPVSSTEPPSTTTYSIGS